MFQVRRIYHVLSPKFRGLGDKCSTCLPPEFETTLVTTSHGSFHLKIYVPALEVGASKVCTGRYEHVYYCGLSTASCLNGNL